MSDQPEPGMDDAVHALFDRYEALFAQALAGKADPAALAGLYAPEVIAASPMGVRAGRNDAAMIAAMAEGHAHDRAIGTRAMRIRSRRLSRIDALHCVAHIGWRAHYARPDLPETVVDFEVHYLVQVLASRARVFGWITGDEDAVLKQHGIT